MLIITPETEAKLHITMSGSFQTEVKLKNMRLENQNYVQN